MTHCFVKDRFVHRLEAKVSIEERGFRFGDGLFETIAVYQGVPYQWALHEARLKDGLAALKITYDTSQLRSLADQLLQKNGLKDGMLRLSISRGAGSRGYLPLPEPLGEPGLLVMETMDKPQRPDEPAVLWHSAIRKISDAALPVQCKLMAAGLNSALARIEAHEHECFDALQINHEGQLCETASANLFWLKEGKLQTPSLDCGVLGGTTRNAVIRLSPYPVEEGYYSLRNMADADAVIVTNASFLAMPVNGLLPEEMIWESQALAEEINALLLQDIAAYVSRQRG